MKLAKLIDVFYFDKEVYTVIKAIIFDFDGLIIDTESVWYEAYKETLLSYEFDLPLAEFGECIGSDETILSTYFKKQLGDSCNVEEIENRALELYKTKMINPKPRDGVINYLNEASEKGYKIGLASSSSREWVTQYLDELDLLRFFEVIVTRDDVKTVKPAPDLYLKAIKDLNIKSSEALAFEDSLNGSIAAITAGLKCVIVPNSVTELSIFNNYDLRLKAMTESSLSDVIKLIEKSL
jgi:putative hydrolase of the HAD superfamily